MHSKCGITGRNNPVLSLHHSASAWSAAHSRKRLTRGSAAATGDPAEGHLKVQHPAVCIIADAG